MLANNKRRIGKDKAMSNDIAGVRVKGHNLKGSLELQRSVIGELHELMHG